MGERKKLEPWQVQAAKNLREVWEEKASGSQEDFGARWGIGGQAAVWQYIRGRIPLNVFVAAKFARGLGVTIDRISPVLADQVREMAPLIETPQNVRAQHEMAQLHRQYLALDDEMRQVVDTLLAKSGESRKRA